MVKMKWVWFDKSGRGGKEVGSKLDFGNVFCRFRLLGGLLRPG